VSDKVDRLLALLSDPANWGLFCHGTSSAYEQDIKRHGLQPRECIIDGENVCRQSVWEGKLESRKDRAYLGWGNDGMAGVCYSAPYKAVMLSGGEPVVYGAHLGLEDEPFLIEDEDALFWIDGHDRNDEDSRSYGRCAHDFWELSEHQRLSEDRWPDAVRQEVIDADLDMEEMHELCRRRPRWVQSLQDIRAMGVRGGVTADRLCGPVPLAEVYYDKRPAGWKPGQVIERSCPHREEK
jgi:hypothetical protein